MDTSSLLPILFLLTALAVVVFALVSRSRTRAEMKDDSPKSTLAADGPDRR